MHEICTMNFPVEIRDCPGDLDGVWGLSAKREYNQQQKIENFDIVSSLAQQFTPLPRDQIYVLSLILPHTQISLSVCHFQSFPPEIAACEWIFQLMLFVFLTSFHYICNVSLELLILEAL